MEWKQWMYDRKSKLREEDTDWNRWLLGKPYQPFDPHVYLEFRLYKDYSSGIFDQWLSHGSDLVHLWTDENYPVSVVANGGIFAWPDGRRKSRHRASPRSLIPRDFSTPIKLSSEIAIAASRESRDATAPSQIMAERARHFLSSARKVAEMRLDGSVNYSKLPIVPPAREEEEIVHVPGAPPPDSRGPDDDDANHLMNWLKAMQTRKQPNANVDHGFSHAIVVHHGGAFLLERQETLLGSEE